MKNKFKDEKLSPAGFAGGQGRKPEETESDAKACAYLAICGILFFGGLGLYSLISHILS